MTFVRIAGRITSDLSRRRRLVIPTTGPHHLTDDQVVSTLQAFDRLARRGIVVNDLIRGRRHLIWSWLFTRPFNEVLRHDGPLSVRRAFRVEELTPLVECTGLGWLRLRTHFGHRLTLAGERPQTSD